MMSYPTQRYWFTDGLAEIGVGVGFLLTGLVLLSLGSLPTLVLKVMAMPAAGLLISWAFPRLIGRVRRRWLNQTAVTAVYRSTLRAQLLGLLILLPIVVWLALNFATLANNFSAADSWPLWCVTIGLFFSLIPLFLGFVSGVLRFYLLALPVIGSGLAAIYVAPSVSVSALLVWFATGISFLCSGVVALIVFQWQSK